MTKKVVKKRITTETVDEEGNLKTVVKEHAPQERPKRVYHKKDDGEKKMTAKERDELLIENFVGLQHAMTNMSIKFGQLSDNISKLLMIFEESAKNFMGGGKPDDKEMLDKIDSLLNQNKTIAKGLVLMEGKLRGRSEEGAQPRERDYSFEPSTSPQVPSPRPIIPQSNASQPGPSFRPKPLPSI